MISIEDVFKKSFLEGFQTSDIRTITLLMVLLLTGAIACYIFLLYRIMTRKTFYSKAFNISLVGVALITSAIIVTIQSSLVVSLGMVGALSIVRFRTAIKDPLDLMYLFWSISTGIICGAGLGKFAIALALMMTFFILVLNKLPMSNCPKILIINSSSLENESRIFELVNKNTKHFSVKSKNITKNSIDYTIEVRGIKEDKLQSELISTQGIIGFSLLEHDGEITF